MPLSAMDQALSSSLHQHRPHQPISWLQPPITFTKLPSLLHKEDTILHQNSVNAYSVGVRDMIFYSDDLLYLLIVGAILFSTFAFRVWGRSKGKTSVHANDDSLNDIAISAIGNLFDTGPEHVIGGTSTFRAPWGARLLIGPILLTFIPAMYVGTKSYHEDSLFLPGAIWALAAFVIYQWMTILFVMKVVVDGETITSHGYSLRPQTRKLADATDIAVDPETNLLTISFKGQKPLHAPRFLSGKAQLVELVETHIQRAARAVVQ